MSEPEPTDLVAEAFAGFTRAATPLVHPAGMAPVRATVRRRRTTRLAVGAVAAVIAVVAPFAYFAQDSDDHHPVPAQSVTPPPSSSPTGSPSATPTGSATPGGPSTITSTTVNCPTGGTSTGGAFTPVSLCDATVVMPAGSCPRPGTVTFAHGTADTHPVTLVLKKAVQVDVDHNGSPDVVALIECQAGDPPTQEVIAFTHNVTGTYALGVVVAPDSKSPEPICGADDLSADSTGAVRVHVDNLAASDGWAYASTIRQWRTYAWNGTAFTQSGGHTSFLADKTVTKLDFTASKINIDPVKNGKRRVWLTATVHNKGTTTATDLTVLGKLDSEPDPAGCPTNGASTTCAISSLAPGKSRTVMVSFLYPPSEVDALIANQAQEDFVQLRLGDQQYAIINKLQLA